MLGRINPGLSPEKLRNEEIAFSWRPSRDFSWDLNVFRYRIRNFIQAAPDPALGGLIRDQNIGRLEGKGLETELRYQLPELPVQLLANFSMARMRNEASGEDRSQVPRQIALLRATWDMNERWQLTAQIMHFGKYEREVDSTPPDPRPDMEGYDTFDLSLPTRISNTLELSAIATNLFDADVREASNGPAPPQTNARIPGDLPQPDGAGEAALVGPIRRVCNRDGGAAVSLRRRILRALFSERAPACPALFLSCVLREGRDGRR